MTQKRYFDYEAPETAWTDLQQFLGIIEPGRYRGFDVLTVVNATTINVGHSSSKGLSSPDLELNMSDNTGIWLSRQGVVVQETATGANITLSTLDNTAGTKTRIFALYGQHQFGEDPSGTIATYGLKAGGTDGSFPTLDTPATQVILSYIYVPAGQNATGGGVYLEIARTKGLGNEDTAQLNEENIFTKINQWKQATTDVVYASSKGDLNKKGNTFKANLTGNLEWLTRTGFQAGARIVVQNTNATERHIYNTSDVSNYNDTYDAGYSHIWFKSGISEGDKEYWPISQYEIAIFELVDRGTTRGIYWHLIWVGDWTEHLRYLLRSDELKNESREITERKPYTEISYTWDTGVGPTWFRAPFYVTQNDADSDPYKYSIPSTYFDPEDEDQERLLRVSALLRLLVATDASDGQVELWLCKNVVAGVPDGTTAVKLMDLFQVGTTAQYTALQMSTVIKGKVTDQFELYIKCGDKLRGLSLVYQDSYAIWEPMDNLFVY